MKWQTLITVVSLLLLGGCISDEETITWADTVKIEEKQYDYRFHLTVADSSIIGTPAGTVKRDVAGKVHSNYRLSNGEATFLQKGTTLYNVKGHPGLLAVKDDLAPNGYLLYQHEITDHYPLSFNELDIENVQQITITHIQNGTPVTATWNDEEKDELLRLLMDSKPDAKFQAYSMEQDPTHFDFVFYTGEDILFTIPLFTDGTTPFWYPFEQEILPEAMNKYLNHHD
ncbi:hypothetical protein [Alteribacter keqinensis]|uniref:Uncharacterized protein n=1 Tax=Alteribacter keqinensis TaxID=2483800 RepID=A0A3M7TX48_9BACI|nr:hypothetical protein [Alteribacter keqinensis]RNA70187.1 hypothetical protein EBO34_09750 [Alteribacter keqinensis]